MAVLAALGTAAGAGAGAAGLSTALAIGGTAISAIGAIQSANAQSAAARYNAQIADRDAVVAEQNRKLALQTARIDAEDKRRDNRRVLARIRTQYGASGLSLAGSPLDVLEDTAVEQELDAQRVEFEGRARGREGALQVLGLQEDAALSRAEASSAKTAGYIGAFGTALSGAGTALSRTA